MTEAQRKRTEGLAEQYAELNIKVYRSRSSQEMAGRVNPITEDQKISTLYYALGVAIGTLDRIHMSGHCLHEGLGETIEDLKTKVRLTIEETVQEIKVADD